ICWTPFLIPQGWRSVPAVRPTLSIPFCRNRVIGSTPFLRHLPAWPIRKIRCQTARLNRVRKSADGFLPWPEVLCISFEGRHFVQGEGRTRNHPLAQHTRTRQD